MGAISYPYLLEKALSRSVKKKCTPQRCLWRREGFEKVRAEEVILMEKKEKVTKDLEMAAGHMEVVIRSRSQEEDRGSSRS